MASDPPPPYPGGPTAPLLEDKQSTPSMEDNRQTHGAYPPSMPFMPPDSGPPPYEATPGYIAPNPGYYPPPPPGPFAPMGYYPPTAGQYPAPSFPSPGGHTTTVIAPPGAGAPSATTTVTVLQGEMFQGSPVQTVCPHCQQPILTKITHEIGLMNFLLCCFCCFVGCDLGCCLIPCIINDLKDVTHTCPNCKAYIYTYRRMG